MNLQDQLQSDLKEAMLSRDEVAVGVLRMLKSEIHNAEKSSENGLNQEQEWQVIRKEVKKRQEANDSFIKAGRPESAAKELQEAQILSKYLPASASTQDIEKFLKDFLAKNPATDPKNKGLAIRETINHFKGSADGKTVSQIIDRLSN